MEFRDTVKETVESCGGIYEGIRGSSVRFREPSTDEICSLYIFAATAQNVALALKSAKEKARAAMWGVTA